MHGTLATRRKKRSALLENVLILVVAAVALLTVRIADRSGLPQKWHSAVLGTVVPFLVNAWFYRARWSRGPFWTSWLLCLLGHIALTWFFLQHVLANVMRIPLIVSYPVVLLESFALLVLVHKLERKLSETSFGRSTLNPPAS
jgi:hypothetical protein